MIRTRSIAGDPLALTATLPRFVLWVAALALCARFAAAASVLDPQEGRVRWSVFDGGESWIPAGVALGDDGATAFAGLTFNEAKLKMYAGGSPTAILDTVPAVGHMMLQAQVAVAASAPVAVSMTTHKTGPLANPEFVALLRAYDLTGDPHPRWEQRFATSDSDTVVGVAVSDDGGVVLAWQSSELEGGMIVKAYDETGAVRSQGLIPRPGGLWPDEAQLSRDGSTAMFSLPLVSQVVLYDVESGSVKALLPDNGIFQGHAMSRDGRRLASVLNVVGSGYLLRVHELDEQGVLQPIFEQTYPTGVRITRVALDFDGSRLAWAVMEINPSDAFTIVLRDLDAGHDLFSRVFTAVDTQLKLWVEAMDIDDAGETIAIANFGDSLGATPEVIVLDDEGELLIGVHARGSALHVDLTPDGELLFAGCKASHASVFGNGGDLYLIETRAQELRIEGQPRIGGTMELAVRAEPTQDRVILATSPALLPMASEGLRLDTSAGRQLVGVWPLVSGELDMPLDAPTDVTLAGTAVHYQALLLDLETGERAWTNKVSVRFLP